MNKTNFVEECQKAYIEKSLKIAHVGLTKENCEIIKKAADLIEQIDSTLFSTILEEYKKALNSIKRAKYHSNYRNIWNLIPRTYLLRQIQDVDFVKTATKNGWSSEQIISLNKSYLKSQCIRDYKFTNIWKMDYGSVDKAVQLRKLIPKLSMVEYLYLISSGGLWGYTRDLKQHERAAKAVIDCAIDAGVNKILVNAIDPYKREWLKRYIQERGVAYVHLTPDDGLKLELSINKTRSLVYIDGFGKFQTPTYINNIKEALPNSVVIDVLTSTKLRLNGSNVSINTLKNDVLTNCEYDVTFQSYGDPKEHSLAVIGDRKPDRVEQILYEIAEENIPLIRRYKHRPFNCSKCGRSFNKKGWRNRHEKECS